MRHLDLCGYLYAARAACDHRDWPAAERTRNRAYQSPELMAWFVGGQIDIMIGTARAEANAEARRPRVEDLRRIAS